MHTVNRRTGESRWQRLKTAALRDADGRGGGRGDA